MPSVVKKNSSRNNQKIRVRDLLDKRVLCEDSAVGEVRGLMVDPVQWKVTHLEVELSKDAAELVLGARKGGIRNLLAVSAIANVGEKVNLKVKKGQLHIYLKAPRLQL